MKANVTVGWVLIAIGVILIFWTLSASYGIFTGEAPPPGIFKEPEETVSYRSSNVSSELSAEMEKVIGDQLSSIFPVENITTMLNFAVWSILAGIFIFGGGKIAEIGIKMIKNDVQR